MSEPLQWLTLVLGIANMLVIPANGLAFRLAWLLERRLSKIERRIVMHHPEDEMLFDRREP